MKKVTNFLIPVWWGKLRVLTVEYDSMDLKFTSWLRLDGLPSSVCYLVE